MRLRGKRGQRRRRTACIFAQSERVLCCSQRFRCSSSETMNKEESNGEQRRPRSDGACAVGRIQWRPTKTQIWLCMRRLIWTFVVRNCLRFSLDVSYSFCYLMRNGHRYLCIYLKEMHFKNMLSYLILSLTVQLYNIFNKVGLKGEEPVDMPYKPHMHSRSHLYSTYVLKITYISYTH